MFINLNSYILCTRLSLTSLLLMLFYRTQSILDHFEFDNLIATQGLKGLRSKRTTHRQTGGGGSFIPSREANDVPGLDEAAQLIPHRDGDAAALIRHLARAHLVPVLCLRHPTCACTAKFSHKTTKNTQITALHDGRRMEKHCNGEVKHNVRHVNREC